MGCMGHGDSGLWPPVQAWAGPTMVLSDFGGNDRDPRWASLGHMTPTLLASVVRSMAPG